MKTNAIVRIILLSLAFAMKQYVLPDFRNMTWPPAFLGPELQSL